MRRLATRRASPLRASARRLEVRGPQAVARTCSRSRERSRAAPVYPTPCSSGRAWRRRRRSRQRAPSSDSLGTPERAPCMPGATRRGTTIRTRAQRPRTSSSTRRRGAPRPSEDLPVHEVADDERNGEAGEDRSQEQEEQGRRARELAREPAPVLDRVDPLLLPRRAVLPDPPDEDQRERCDEAPHPGERHPLDVPGLHRMLCLVMREQVLVDLFFNVPALT